MRISRDKMLMDIAHVVAQRSTCNRKQIGAVIAQGGRVVSIGYGGAPAGEGHCIDIGCEIGPNGGCIRTTHSEQNAISFAARYGISIDGATLYSTSSPCLDCAKLLINSGIIKLVYDEEYRDVRGLHLLAKYLTIVRYSHDSL